MEQYMIFLVNIQHFWIREVYIETELINDKKFPDQLLETCLWVNEVLAADICSTPYWKKYAWINMRVDDYDYFPYNKPQIHNTYFLYQISNHSRQPHLYLHIYSPSSDTNISAACHLCKCFLNTFKRIHSGMQQNYAMLFFMRIFCVVLWRSSCTISKALVDDIAYL